MFDVKYDKSTSLILTVVSMPPESFNEAIDSPPESTFESGSGSRFLPIFSFTFSIDPRERLSEISSDLLAMIVNNL